jgi:pimeloyl-ACP methyl ester carboxylesterase
MPIGLFLVVAALTLAIAAAPGAELRLKNGTVLHGNIDKLDTLLVGPKRPKEGVVPNYPIYVIDTPLKRYAVHRSQEDTLNPDAELIRLEGYKIEQTRKPNSGQIIDAVQGFTRPPGPFDEHGRRRVLLNTANGELEVIQGITNLTPEWTKVAAINYKWETAVATNSIPFEHLNAILRAHTQQKNPGARFKLAVFLIQAQFFGKAEEELEAIAKEFPEQADKVKVATKQLHVARAMEYLREMKLRRAAGQHALVYALCQKFPVDDVAPATLREVRDLTQDYEQALEKGERCKVDLGSLQGQLKDDSRVKELAPIRTEISDSLNYSNLDRLDAFIKLSADPQLKPDEKLALALSGWAVGSSNAVTVLDQALRFWQARYLLIEYLRSAPEAESDRKSILTRLAALDGVGPERIAQMLPLLPAAGDTTGIVPGQAVKITIPGDKAGEDLNYWVSLPREYHVDHSYPLIIALHGEKGTPVQEMQGFWGGTEDRDGQSQRHGYIVAAPDYIPKGVKGYDYSEASHRIVVDVLRDALRRYSVDADRVFLAGHDMGGDAAWDMGLAHPYLFAGVVAINGAIDKYAVHYLENGKSLPFYSIVGEKDTNLFDRNTGHIMKIFKNGTDLIHCVYKGAGPESFYSEIHALFDWMSNLRRDPIPKQVDVRTLREYDSSFSWFEFSGIPENMKGLDWSSRQRAVQPLIVSAKITPASSILVTSPRVARNRIWIPRGEGLVDFNKRLVIRINGKQVWNDFVKPDVEAMLERVRTTGDRQQLFWGVLDFPTGR